MRNWWAPLVLVGCATTPPPPPETAPLVAEPVAVAVEPFVCPEKPGLCFRVEPANAELVVNSETRGRLDEIGADGQLFLPLDAGIYLVTLSAEGYKTWRTEVSVQDGAESIEVALTPQE